MLIRTTVIVFLVLLHVDFVQAQGSSAPSPALSNQNCPPPKPDSGPKRIGGIASSPDDTKLPGGSVACATTGAPNEATRTDPGSTVMTTSPTGMMTNPGLQPMPDPPNMTPPQ